MKFWQITLLAGALATSAATQASALSCAQPQIERSVNWWIDSPDTYYIGVGTLTAAGPLPHIPDARELSSGAPAPDLNARFIFDGHLVTGYRTQPLRTEITVSVGCAGPWCGSFPLQGVQGLMPLKFTSLYDISVNIGACPGAIFSTDTESTVAACLRAGRCAEPAQNWQQ